MMKTYWSLLYKTKIMRDHLAHKTTQKFSKRSYSIIIAPSHKTNFIWKMGGLY